MPDNAPVITQSEQETAQKDFSKIVTLLNFLKLKPERAPYRILLTDKFPFKITPSYANKIKKADWFDPLLLQCLPRKEESIKVHGYNHDPVCDEEATALPGLIHKYKNRVLLTASPKCAIHCRYCFRKNYAYHEFSRSKEAWNSIWNYIRNHLEINEVILSGGDPLTLSTNQLKDIFQSLHNIPHIDTVRIHSRIPAVSPQRINANFTGMLNDFQQAGLNFVMVHHINHPNEIASDNASVFKKIKNLGILQLNQSVLLKKVNDKAVTLIELSRKLLKNGVLPYYLHQLDQVTGTQHFFVEPEKGKKIMSEMVKELQGYGVPKYVCEVAGEESKIGIL